LNDAFWITPEGSDDRFAHFNLYENPISRILSDIAFTGFGSRLKSEFRSSPEFTTNGMLAKSWRRLSGRILLYKSELKCCQYGPGALFEFYAHQVAAALGIQSVLIAWLAGTKSCAQLASCLPIWMSDMYP
jgi:hypothetical protein